MHTTYSREALNEFTKEELIDFIEVLQKKLPWLGNRSVIRDSAIETYLGEHKVRWIRTVFLGTQQIDTSHMERTFETDVDAQTFSRFLYQQFQTPSFDQLEANFWGETSREFYLEGKPYERQVG